jgi:hypothetical protein
MAGASDVVPGAPVWLFKSSRECEFRSNMAKALNKALNKGLNPACWILRLQGPEDKDLKT